MPTMTEDFDPSAVQTREMEVRPVRADERRRWDALMDRHHYLGFKQFAGRGLRQVAVWRGHRLALLWQQRRNALIWYWGEFLGLVTPQGFR